jgi:hypothetical protein
VIFQTFQVIWFVIICLSLNEEKSRNNFNKCYEERGILKTKIMIFLLIFLDWL